MIDFKIKQGLSEVLFPEPGVVNPRLIIEEGCWYLCTDTAELFLGVLENNKLTLKKINDASNSKPPQDPGAGDSPENGNLADLEYAIGVLEDEVSALKEVKLFKKMASPEELPTSSDEAFDPNVTYYTLTASGILNTYIYDADSDKYLQANNGSGESANAAVSIASAEINADGDLVLYYTNGTNSIVGRVVGAAGKDGLTTTIQIGDTIYEHNNGAIILPTFVTESFVRDAIAEAEDKVDLSAYAKLEDIPDTSKFITEVPEEYITEDELNAKGYLTQHQDLSGKSDVGHTHDNLYDAKGAAEAVKNDLLNGAGVAYDTLKELGDLIDTNQDAITALETLAAGKADKEHKHSEYLTEHQSLDGLATEDFVTDKIAEAQLGGGEVDLENYATKSDIANLASIEYVNDTITEQVPEVVAQVFETVVLFGGDATP